MIWLTMAGADASTLRVRCSPMCSTNAMRITTIRSGTFPRRSVQKLQFWSRNWVATTWECPIMKTKAPNCASTRLCNREESTVLSLTGSGGKAASAGCASSFAVRGSDGAKMKSLAACCLATCLLGSLALSQEQGNAPRTAPLLLVQEIPLPGVQGRIDHFTFDAKRKRVIGAALGNNTVEVVDTFAGRVIKSIQGAAEPQGVAYVGEFNKLFVANGEDGKLRVYDGDSFKLLNTLDIGEDADNVRYSPTDKKVYVGYGGD